MFLIIFGTVFAYILAVIGLSYIRRYREESSKNYIVQYPGLPYFGLGFEFAGKGSEEIFQKLIKLTNGTGGLGRGFAGHHKFAFVALPEHIEVIVSDSRFFEKSDEYDMLQPWLQTGLLTVNDRKKWQRRRKVLTPAFHFKILEDFVHVFEKQAGTLLNALEKHADRGAFDVCNYINLYTLDVICETSMGVTINAQADKESPYVKAVLELSNVLQWRQSHFLARDNWYWRFTPQKRRHDQLVKKIHEFTISVIENKRKEKQKIDVNENVEDDFGIKRRSALLDVLLESKVDGVPLSTKDIHEETDTFMFAGHDTTTSAIEFLLYNLGQYPEIQEKVYNEITEVFGRDFSEPVTIAKLNSLSYMDIVIKESLRLFPPVPMIARHLKEELEINGIVYPKDHNIILFIYNLHRDERFHKKAAEFIPERFLEQRDHETTNAFSYIPFSAGHRNCIGQKFAQYEIKTVISKILSKFKVQAEEGFKVRYAYELILRPINGIQLKLVKRD